MQDIVQKLEQKENNMEIGKKIRYSVQKNQ